MLTGDGALPASVREDVLVLVTELVTNGVRHAEVGPGQYLRVELPRAGRRGDPGTGFTRALAPSRGDESGGWGLFSSTPDRLSRGGQAHGLGHVRVVRDPVRGVSFDPPKIADPPGGVA